MRERWPGYDNSVPLSHIDDRFPSVPKILKQLFLQVKQSKNGKVVFPSVFAKQAPADKAKSGTLLILPPSH